MNEAKSEIVQYVRGLEASANQLSTALHWLSSSLLEEARLGRSVGLSMAAQMNGPVRALSVALMNLNDGVAALLLQAESDLRQVSEGSAQPQDGEHIH